MAYLYSCMDFCWGWPVKRFDSETQAQNARMLHTWHQQSNATVWELSDSCWGGISAYPTQCHQQLSGKWQAEASCYFLQALDITRITRTSENPINFRFSLVIPSKLHFKGRPCLRWVSEWLLPRRIPECWTHMPSLQRELQSVPLSHRVSEMAKIGEIWEFLCSNRWEASLSTAEVSTVKRFLGLWPWNFLLFQILPTFAHAMRISGVSSAGTMHTSLPTRSYQYLPRGFKVLRSLQTRKKRWFTSSQVHKNYWFRYTQMKKIFSSIWCFSTSNLQVFEAGTAQNLGSNLNHRITSPDQTSKFL